MGEYKDYYVGIYKCRMCGLVEEQGSQPTEMWRAARYRGVFGNWERVQSHTCVDRKIGLMDLIGWRKDTAL